MNAATYLYVCQHNTEDDTRYMAKKLGVSSNKIPRVPLQFMVWTPSKGEMASGNVTFNQQSKPVFLKKGAGAKRLGISSVCGVFNGLSYR